MISILNFINFLYNAKISDGFSVNGLGDSPASGYMVSLEGYEKVIDHVPSMGEIICYIEVNYELIWNEQNYIGGWLDGETGKYFLDISENIQDKAEALRIAAERKQLAIFDLSTFESIYL